LIALQQRQALCNKSDDPVKLFSKEPSMKAYFVHDARKLLDHIVIPELDALVRVDRFTMEGFIGVSPHFDQWQRTPLRGLAPTSLGCIVAIRENQGDVCIEDSCLWQERMQHYLG
jgi:hypothetical protein